MDMKEAIKELKEELSVAKLYIEGDGGKTEAGLFRANQKVRAYEALISLAEEYEKCSGLELLGALARGYCTEKNKHKVVDPDLIEAMALEVTLALMKKLDGIDDVGYKTALRIDVPTLIARTLVTDIRDHILGKEK